MAYIKAREADYALLRQKKQELFAPRWNSFIRSPRVILPLCLYTLSQILTVFLTWPYIRQLVDDYTFCDEEYLWILNLSVWVIRLILTVPGFLLCTGLWLTVAKGLWKGASPANTVGLRLMLYTLNVLSTVFLLGLVAYAYLMQNAAAYFGVNAGNLVFCLMVFATCLMAAHFLLIRKVLHLAEENAECGKISRQGVLLLIGLLVLAAGAVAALAPKLGVMPFVLGLLALALLLWFYFLFLKETEKVFSTIRILRADNEHTEYE